MYLPQEEEDGSTDMDWTGPIWASSLTCGVDMLGDHNVT